MGMTLEELAHFMRMRLGNFSLSQENAYQGLNLDGGGSTTMVVKGEVVNSPSDQTGERPVANALIIAGVSKHGAVECGGLAHAGHGYADGGWRRW